MNKVDPIGLTYVCIGPVCIGPDGKEVKGIIKKVEETSSGAKVTLELPDGTKYVYLEEKR